MDASLPVERGVHPIFSNSTVLCGQQKGHPEGWPFYVWSHQFAFAQGTMAS